MKRKLKKAALIGLCVSMTMGNLTQILAETRSASGQNFEKIVTTGSNALPATGSNGIENYALRSVKTGDLWKDWIGDLSFLNGERGNGTEEEPYQISTKAHLMGLSELAARGMVVDEDEGDWPGDYTGAHFILTRNIDLGGMEWMPIGFIATKPTFLQGM